MCIFSWTRLEKYKNDTSVLSPKKSIEGAVGGIIGSALIGALYGTIFKTNLTELKPLFFFVIGHADEALSPFGHLSGLVGIKRQYQIKDYGNLIPGHGGIMDRFDSIILQHCLTSILATLLTHYVLERIINEERQVFIMKKIAILGSTGSIGTQSLEVIRSQPDMEATVLAAGSNVELLEKADYEFPIQSLGMGASYE